ncbi:hypothetical protein [Paraburkholderia phytofirmans]|uniref:Uncharacterized protein n=1 Tax=Paraburkholderia phytofirmans (strain DSM 17436 / LMG 22146 / PsJN) TaxID=398527 RepID=B2T893_PARPJ|nr:hypothetical protein [Paraburkholderia phytofirmans]ACD20361.1 conserved hypothetical protein [Paraburkholderia phytofirmans PsJN]
MNHALVEFQPSAHTARVAAIHPDDAHLSAYNAAFSDLGLRFRWDRTTLDVLKEFNSEAARITAYIERFHAHLHSAYDADFLAQMILHKKAQYFSEFAPAGE